jgi:hypothetical protein
VTEHTRVIFPNLVAIISDFSEITRTSNGRGQVRGAGFAISLFKPVRTAALFGMITGTPVYCFPRRRHGPSSHPLESIPSFLPLQGLRSMQLEKGHGAGLICDAAETPTWTTGISLCAVEFRPTVHGENDDDRDVDTLYALMRLAGRLRSRDAEGESSNASRCVHGAHPIFQAICMGDRMIFLLI